MAAVRQTPATVDLHLVRSDDMTFQLRRETATPSIYFDFTGYTATASVRTAPDATPIATLTAAPYSNSAADRGIEVTITAAQSTEFPDRAFWDCQLTDTDDKARTWFAGYVYTLRQGETA